MKKLFILILLLLISLFFLLLLSMKNPLVVCFQNQCFDIEIADTPYLRKQGLMNREFLPKDKGMFFIFDKPGVYKFWMKNTLIPLDIIWLNKNKEIIFIEHNALPCKEENCVNYGPEKEAKYVLEINGGLSENLNLQVGDKASFSLY